MAFARVNGVVIHHEVRGPAGAPVIAFSNSLGTDFRIWDAVAARLEDAYRLVLYDKRGHGLSESTPAPYALSDHVDDLPRCSTISASPGRRWSASRSAA